MGCKLLVARLLEMCLLTRPIADKNYNILYLDALSFAFKFFYTYTNLTKKEAVMFGKHMGYFLLKIENSYKLTKDYKLYILRDGFSPQQKKVYRTKQNDVIRDLKYRVKFMLNAHQEGIENGLRNVLKSSQLMIEMKATYNGEAEAYPWVEYRRHENDNVLVISFDSDIFLYSVFYPTLNIDCCFVSSKEPKEYLYLERQLLTKSNILFLLFHVVCNGCDYLPILFGGKIDNFDQFFSERSLHVFEKQLEAIGISITTCTTLDQIFKLYFPYFWYLIFYKCKITNRDEHQSAETLTKIFYDHWDEFNNFILYMTTFRIHTRIGASKIIKNNFAKDFYKDLFENHKEKIYYLYYNKYTMCKP